MDQENLTCIPIPETLARSGQDGAPSGLAFASDATLDRIEFSVPGSIVDQLEKTSKVEGVDVSCMLLSAFASVLHRYTGGVLDEWIRADAQQTFGELARQLSSDSSYGFDSECFSKLFCVSDFPRDIGTPTIPQCRILFVCDAWDRESRQAIADGQNASCSRSQETREATHDFSLRLFAERNSDSTLRVKGSLVYRSQWWLRDRAERFVGHFLTLVSQATTGPDTVAAKLPILTTREQRQLLVEFNDTSCEYPRELCVHELFEQQAERSPDAVALVFEDQQLSYSELNARSNRLARYLRKHGVGDQTPVGLCLERSLDLVVSILGILKAGGTYVPLDADYPAKRLENMLELAQVKHLVTQSDLKDRLPRSKRQDILVDRDADEIASEDSSNLDLAYKSNRLAYIMFTSGSTGEPKGVMIEHRSIVRLVCHVQYARFGSDRVFVLLAPVSFDASTFELWGALLHGGRLVIPAQALHDANLLKQLIVGNKVTTLWLTASLFNQIVDQDPHALLGLDELLIGGEALSVMHVKEAIKALKDTATIINGYGPTESTTFACCFRILPTLPLNVDSIPIGRPISNTQVYVLGSHRELLPIGVPGELYIGGDGSARGYLNRPDLTAERFVPNPFSKDSDSKLYRTGDLCRWRDDGTLEYLGRIDHQVKLRGFRIELGEIESILSQHPSIAQCVVILREDRPGDKRLVAYYTQCDEQTPSVLELRESLGTKLPEYMVPAAYVKLDTLPLTPSGKIDRRALPLPDSKDVGVQDQYTPARNGIEEQLAQIWSEVLGIERIGIHDNFFALGGHSLLAVRLTSRIAEIFEVSLGVRRIFEQPTIAQLSEQIEAKRIGGSKHALLPLRSVFRDPDELSPVSYAQERLWFLEQLEGSLTAYNIPMVWRFRGSVDNEALRKSLETIIARHEPLRTVFVHDGNTPVQMVRGLERFEFHVEDLQGLDPEDQKLKAAQICRAEADCPFDLTCDLMIRARLLRLDDQDHRLLVTMHHIASDGWSMAVFTKELSALYGHYLDASTETSGITSGTIPLDPLPVTYIDYSAWQRETLSADRIEGLLSYWRQELKGLPALEFPTDRPRPVMASYRGSSVPIEFNEGLTRRLESLAQSQQVTLQMLLLAAYEVLLYRYSHQEDFAVGIPFAGRNETQLERLIGFFVSTLVIRADLTGEPTFQELLSRVRQKSLAAYDHQELPLQVLLADLQPERHLSRPPLFQVMFQLLTQDASGLNLQGLELIEEYYSTERVKFDLEMHLSRDQGRILGDLAYSSDLFDHSTIERMAEQYVRLLESIVAQPDQKIGRFSILTDQERDRLLIEFNNTACEYPRELCVHELFEQQAERSPDAVALVFEDQQLSYSELNARSNRLARYLRKHGVGDQTPVGLCLERSLDLVVSILGILKAGGTYVPLDADYPVKRLESMLDLAQVEHLVTQSDLHDKLPSTKRQDIWVDRDADEIASEDSSNLDLAYDSHRLAYIMFTSGSTGEPKGVMIEHLGASNLLVDMAMRLKVKSTDRILSVTTPSFDISVLEFFVPLISGGSLEIASMGSIRDTGALITKLETGSISWMQSTPSRWEQLIQGGWRGDGRLQILCGGEPLSEALAKQLATRCESLWNVYGPTETTIWSTSVEISGDEQSISIGRPISNTQVYVLGSHRELLPIGVPGELYIGGDGSARGYLNRPDLTAERFVPNPFSKDSDSKLYRTGDLCRWRDDGTLEYLGRIDHQVKMRGFRIELGEIESILSQHPSIAQCVVILREDRPGDKRLVAYYTQCDEQTPSVLELRESLGTKLPEYMVPAAYVKLDALPLTPSGKIDRRSLPLPDIKDVGVQDQYTPARNGIEAQLTQIWSEVLGIERIGIHDNFFALGGHSLLAVRLFSEINKRLGQKLPLSILFQQGTISQIAQMIHESPNDQPIARIVQLSDCKEGSPLVVMPGLNGELLYSKELVDRIEHRYNVVGLQPNLDPRFLETYADFGRMASEYVRILRAYQPQGPYRVLGYSYGGILSFEIARQLEEQGQAVDFCGVIDTGIEPDLSYRQLGSVAVHLGCVSINLPRWIAASCGPGNFRNTMNRANRKLRYFGRSLLARGKIKYTFEDEFGTKRSHDYRRKVLGCIFQSFNDYKPRNYLGRVTLFRAVVRPLFKCLSPDLGWSRIAAHVDVHSVPGDHETILHSAQIDCIGKVIRESVEGLATNDHA